MLMRLLTSILPDLTPQKTKIHLAQHNKHEHPMDVYLAGEFDEWQSSQTRANFTNEFLIGFVEIPGSPRWLMTGVYDELKIIKTKLDEKGKQNHIYSYRKHSEFAELEGRWSWNTPSPRRVISCLKIATRISSYRPFLNRK